MTLKWMAIVCVFLYSNAAEDQTGILEKLPRSIVELNSCFRYVPSIRLKISSEHIGGTESIQFKDECLKACLRSMIQRVFVCKSLMHIPSDDDCFLTTTDMNHTEYEKDTNFPPVNYYENLCAQSPFGSAAALSEARFNGYKGGEGIIQIAQKYGEPTKALLIIDGLREKTKFQVRHYPNGLDNCYKLKREEVAKSKPLFEITTDYAGTAILSWTTIELDHENVLETWILVVEDDDNTISECGKIHFALDSPVNGVSLREYWLNLLLIFCLLALYFM